MSRWCMSLVCVLCLVMSSLANAADSLDYCEQALGNSGARGEYREMENAMGMSVAGPYRNFCRTPAALESSFAVHLYQWAERKQRRGRAFLGLGIGSFVVFGGLSGVHAWLAVKERRKCKRNGGCWFPGWDHILWSVLLGDVALASTIVCTIFGLKQHGTGTRFMKILKPYQHNDRSKHLDEQSMRLQPVVGVLMGPLGAGLRVAF
jgi:hypothetical protein